MGLKYAECLLSLNYRVVHEDGTTGGGPMYYLEKGLGKKWLGVAFAIFAAIASFGIGNMVQANSVAEPLLDSFGVPKIVTGIVLAVLSFAVIVGGVKRIGAFSSKIVPAMAIFYVVSAFIVILTHLNGVPAAFAQIFHDAFSGTAATGGFVGAGVAQAIQLRCGQRCFLRMRPG